jgi:hypothetical protein
MTLGQKGREGRKRSIKKSLFFNAKDANVTRMDTNNVRVHSRFFSCVSRLGGMLDAVVFGEYY